MMWAQPKSHPGVYDLSIPIESNLIKDELLYGAKRIYAVPYSYSTTRNVLYYIFSILTLGVFSLVLSWFPLWYYRVRFRRSDDVLSASFLMIFRDDNTTTVVSCQRFSVSAQELRQCCSSLSKMDPWETDTLCSSLYHSILNDTRHCVETVKFSDQYSSFVYNVWMKRFEAIQFNTLMRPSEILNRYGNGVANSDVRQQRRALYGRSVVEFDLKPFYVILRDEVFHPFYVFQIIAIALWLWDEYYQYAGAVIIITVISLGVEILEIYRTQKRLELIAKEATKVKVMVRDPKPRICEMSSHDLVPGDLLIIENSLAVPCDVLVLQGTVLVNEDALTGESIPVMKSALSCSSENDAHPFMYHLNKNRMLFGGTTVVLTKSACLSMPQTEHYAETYGMVTHTGLSTCQGQMLRFILYPSSKDGANFKVETYKFLGMLSIFACFGSLLSAYLSWMKNHQWLTIAFRGVDSFSNAIPPSLTASMTVGCSIAVAKLRSFWRILCLQPSRINVAGQVNTMVFDKTGTLTEVGLQLETVSYLRLLHNVRFMPKGGSSAPLIPSLMLTSSTRDLREIPSILVKAMATCHTVTVVDNGFLGEPMEVEMLRFTQYSIDEKPQLGDVWSHEKCNNPETPLLTVNEIFNRHLVCIAELCSAGNREGCCDLITFTNDENQIASTPHTLRILKVFEFSSHLQRMSVIVWDTNQEELWVFCKGAPEQVSQRCLPSSIALDYNETLRRYTEAGSRVLMFSGKRISLVNLSQNTLSDNVAAIELCAQTIESYSRDEAERDLSFLGMSIFTNKLKPDAKTTIDTLKDANCRCIMSTGDNPLTAISVARSAGIIRSSTEYVILGDAHPTNMNGDHVQERVLWTPILYSPTVDCASPKIGDTLSSPMHVLSIDTSITTLEVASFEEDALEATEGSHVTNDDSSCSLTPTCNKRCVVALKDLTCEPFTQELLRGTYTSYEIKKYLHNKNPRDVVLVLTGAAFRVLQSENEALNVTFHTTRACHHNGAKGPTRLDADGIWSAISSAVAWYRTTALFFRSSLESNKNGLQPYEQEDLESCIETASSADTVKENNASLDESTPLLPHSNCVLRIVAYPTTSQPYGYNLDYQANLYSSSHKGGTVIKKQHWERLSRKTSAIENASPTTRRNAMRGCHVETVDMFLYEFCLRYCRVYARMSPDEKAALIKEIRRLPGSPPVGMCGDGANDCAALRVADFGISLGDKEESLAASFTSATRELRSVVDLMREGRSALVNSFQSFKYIALYAMLQLVTSLSLYYYGCNLTDPQYLWVDLIVVLPLTMTMAWTHASNEMASELPLKRLTSLPVVLSLVGQIAIQSFFTITALAFLQSREFYKPYVPNTERVHFDPDSLKGFENTTVFFLSSFQYIVTCLALSLGRPWRKPIYTNIMFTGLIVTLTIMSVVTLLAPHSLFASWLSIVQLPLSFRLSLAVLILVNTCITFAFEVIVINKWASRRETSKDYLSHFIDGVLPSSDSHFLRFAHFS